MATITHLTCDECGLPVLMLIKMDEEIVPGQPKQICGECFEAGLRQAWGEDES